VPAGQHKILLTYWIAYDDNTVQDTTLLYSLYVKINGVVVGTVANQAPVTPALFTGVPPECSEINTEVNCLYSACSVTFAGRYSIFRESWQRKATFLIRRFNKCVPKLG